MAELEHPLFYNLSNKFVVLCLSFIGGFIDATGYIKLYGLFTSSITGNLVVACTGFFGHSEGVFARLFVSVAFAFGAFVSTFYIVRQRCVFKLNQWDIGVHLFSAECIVLLIALIFGVSIDYSADQFPSLNSWQAIITGSGLALAMGIHNAAGQDLIENCPSTTVMTMTIIKTSMFAANALQYYMATTVHYLLYPASEGKPADYDSNMRKNYEKFSAKFYETVQPLIVFVIGATIGAVLALNMTFWCLFMPMLLLIGMVFSIRKADGVRKGNQHAAVGDVELESTASPITEKYEEAIAYTISEGDEVYEESK